MTSNLRDPVHAIYMYYIFPLCLNTSPLIFKSIDNTPALLHCRAAQRGAQDDGLRPLVAHHRVLEVRDEVGI